MHILGISSLEHDSAAALLEAQGITAAIEEGKLLRTRDYHGIPRRAINFCLTKTGIQWKDLTNVAVARRILPWWSRRLVAPNYRNYYATTKLEELVKVWDQHHIPKRSNGDQPFLLHFDHALCHTASAFYASPFDRALILTLDEQGDGRCGLAAVGEGLEIRELRSIPFPNSLGWIYSQVTELLGFRKRWEEHKTQWLGITGEPVFRDLFFEVLGCRDRKIPWPHINPRFIQRDSVHKVALSHEFYRRLGISKPVSSVADESLRANLAASVQQTCSTIVIELLEALRRQSGTRYLCLAGGLFLNPVIVAAVEKNTGFDRVFVQPAAGNAGTALGAAWLAYHSVHKYPRVPPLERLDLGPAYSNEEIKHVLDNCKVSYRFTDSEDRKLEAALKLLGGGRIVAWFQGGAEFGPRALGNRSLLASPWAPYVKENLNNYVKHREAFRPFALCVCEEDLSGYFECSSAGRFLTTMGHAHPESRKILNGFILPRDLVRLHVVARRTNPLLWKLLQRFGENAPAPLLVNTSFNLFGEPLVITPRDAVRSYFCSGTDALIAGDFVLSKS